MASVQRAFAQKLSKLVENLILVRGGVYVPAYGFHVQSFFFTYTLWFNQNTLCTGKLSLLLFHTAENDNFYILYTSMACSMFWCRFHAIAVYVSEAQGELFRWAGHVA